MPIRTCRFETARRPKQPDARVRLQGHLAGKGMSMEAEGGHANDLKKIAGVRKHTAIFFNKTPSGIRSYNPLINLI